MGVPWWQDWSLISGNLELTEHLASKWVEPSEIETKDFLEADKPILDNLKSGNGDTQKRKRKIGVANGKYNFDFEVFDKLDDYITEIFGV